MRTGPHDYGPREWGVFFFTHRQSLQRSASHLDLRVRAALLSRASDVAATSVRVAYT